jgi:hypothetical protein
MGAATGDGFDTTRLFMQKRKLSALLATLGISAFQFSSSPAHAAGGFQGLIVQLNVQANGVVVVQGSGFFGTRPSCMASANTHSMAFDGTTSAGKNLLATLTAAHLAGRNVGLVGDGVSCVESRERLSVVVLGNT